MQALFDFVRDGLLFGSQATGLTYREVNVVVYFGLIPLVYVALVDKILERHVCKGVFLASVVLALVLFDFEPSCDALFALSVGFLRLFGSSWEAYVAASLVFCVALPLSVFAGLLGRAYRDELRRLGAALRRARRGERA